MKIAGRATPLEANPPKWIFFAVFTVSGFSGLIYESIWSHYLKLFLGHAAYAQSLVLMIFMGGLALGSWLTARWSERIRAPILAYAVVEAVIGLIALLFHSGFVTVSDAFYFSLLPAVATPFLAGLLKWTAAAALIVPQSVLLGMTFPLMTAGILRRFPRGTGASLSMLYFTNSLGAAVGVLVSGFWLIALVGLPGTIMTAGLLNIALAIVVWFLVRLDTGQAAAVPAPAPPHPSRDPGSHREAPDGMATLFFFAAGITGAASFIYEIGWLRMLSLVLGATTHSFELMLSAFITGLAFGGLWIKRRIDRIEDPIRFSGWVQVLMGALAILTVPVYVQTFDWMAALLSGLQRSDVGYDLFTLASHGISLAVMLPTTFLAGMTLPLFTHVLMRGRQGERAIGRVYAANTLGAIAGVLFAVHVGLPLLGLKSLIAFGAALDVVLGLVLLHRANKGKVVGPLARGALVGLASLVFVVTAVELEPRRVLSGVYRYRTSELDEQSRVLYHRHGKTASISLVARGSQVAISTNGKPDAGLEMDPERPPTPDEVTMVMAAALGLAYSPEARHVANIGLGSGLTTHTLLADPAVDSVDTVEIEAAVAQLAQGFGERVQRAFTDPRSHIHIEDAKTFFSLRNRRYDVMVAEPSNPWVSGVASLFSKEFYRTVREYLDEDGVIVQWLQLYEFNDKLALSVLKALSQGFSDYAIYNSDDVNVLIVAKPSGTLPEPDFDRLFGGDLGAELGRVGLRDAADFRVRQTGDERIFRALTAQSGVPTNSDYFPYLDLNAGRARFRGQVATMFHRWSIASLPVLEMLDVARVDHARVTSGRQFNRASMIERAYEIRDVLSERGPSSAAPRSGSLGPALTSLRLLARICETTAYEQEWLHALHRLAQVTLPFLEASDAAALLDGLVETSCLEGSSRTIRSWYALYRAVAERDATRMAAAARNVIETVELDDDSRARYALSAGMLGHVAEDRPHKALELWDGRGGLGADVGTTPELELIVRMARGSLSTQAAAELVRRGETHDLP